PGAAPQVTQATRAVALPDIVVRPKPEGWYDDPYVGARGPRPSSEHRLPAEHYTVPTGYDADVGLHPYTRASARVRKARPRPRAAGTRQAIRFPRRITSGRPSTADGYSRRRDRCYAYFLRPWRPSVFLVSDDDLSMMK